MGCLPIIFLFLIGTAVGWFSGQETGAVWGAAIGALIGTLVMLLLAFITHKHRTGAPRSNSENN